MHWQSPQFYWVLCLSRVSVNTFFSYCYSRHALSHLKKKEDPSINCSPTCWRSKLHWGYYLYVFSYSYSLTKLSKRNRWDRHSLMQLTHLVFSHKIVLTTSVSYLLRQQLQASDHNRHDGSPCILSDGANNPLPQPQHGNSNAYFQVQKVRKKALVSWWIGNLEGILRKSLLFICLEI